MMQLRYSGSWCSKCPLRQKKSGKRWGSGRMKGLVTLSWAFCLWVSHSNPPWVMSTQQLPATAGSLGPCRPGWQVSPAIHMALIHTMLHEWSQERTVGNKPALEGSVCWEQRPAWATARPAIVRDAHPADPGKSRLSCSFRPPCSFSLHFGSHTLYVMGSWGTKPTKTPQSKPTPSLHYYLFFYRCPNPTH